MDIRNLTKKNNKVAAGKVAKGFSKEHAPEAPEALPTGPLAIGVNPGSEPVVDGTTDDLGVALPIPSERGEGAGAYIESWATEVGGAISGGNCCAPASCFEFSYKCNLKSLDDEYHNTNLNHIKKNHNPLIKFLPGFPR